MGEHKAKRDRRPAVWLLAYAFAIILVPMFLAWLFAGLEGGYVGSGRLAPGFRPLIFFAVPTFFVTVMMFQFVVTFAVKQLRPSWLIAIPAMALFAVLANPVERWWCATSHVCWVAD